MESPAAHRSVPPQFQPTAPSSSKVSRQLLLRRQLDSADPTALWTGVEAALDERGRRRREDVRVCERKDLRVLMVSSIRLLSSILFSSKPLFEWHDFGPCKY